MRFYTNTHNYYCGIDLHAKTMYLCIFDREGKILTIIGLPSITPLRSLTTLHNAGSRRSGRLDSRMCPRGCEL